MSRSTIEGKLRGLEQRLQNEMRISGFPSPGGVGASRNGNTRRPRPTMFAPNRDMLAFPPRSPQATETEHRMREVYKVSGKLNVEGKEYSSNVDDLQLLGDLGSGTCGHVVKMMHKPSGAVIAVKQMRRSGNSEETKRILMDLDVVVRSHGCPYIVRCLGCFVTDSDVWICMELMETCFDKLLKRLAAPVPEPILGKVTVATVNALSYLKDTHGVIHRDVKPSNILLDARGNVKLCDFGISGRLVDSKAKTRSAGCAAYMAPERIDPPDPTRPDYDIRADVWSLGISLVELATGVFPYRDCQNDFEVLTRVIADDPPQLPDDSDFSQEFKSFVSQCLTKNYRQRPKYAKLLEHPFVVKSAQSVVSVESWYASLPINGQSPTQKTVSTTATHIVRPSQNPSYAQSAQKYSQNQGYGQNGQDYSQNQGYAQSYSQSGQAFNQSGHIYGQSGQVHSQSGQSYGQSGHSYGQSHTNHNGVESPVTPQPIRNFVTSSQHWMSEQITPTPARACWAGQANAGGSSSQPASLEGDYPNHSPYARRRWDGSGEFGSPPSAPRRPSADAKWKPSPASSGNTSPIVLQRFYHQSQQRRSRVDLHGSPRHRSLSREHSTGRSPEPPPRRQRRLVCPRGSEPLPQPNGGDSEPPPLHERLHPHPPSPLLLNDRLSEGRSQSLTRAELRNGHRPPAELPQHSPHADKHYHDDHGWLHSLAGLLKRRLSGYVNWSHVAARQRHRNPTWGNGNSESWSVPASPLPPRAPPPRPQ
ncbi:dual specificity mitogen-activated protein kinase kinase 7-like isoform X2 [Plodia interpunctella]|uniref:dual specificity mitogen-activated protein kinase kinase 7-like isoform X2 n=1 Tax=Plodia interpunctella TaxID=58824 RepID=UPI002368A13A|nr:dual specificity mitogen-activated protein kinase kinase 7-like isoform X2 [Plodia interpunctella]